MARRSVIVMSLLPFFLLIVTSAGAATWYVRTYGNNDNPGTEAAPWGTIQFAINNSAVSDGDTILVGDGNYTENIDVTKEITLQSENGANSTIIKALMANDHTIAVMSNHIVVEGFGVWGANDGTSSVVAGIYLASGTRYGSIIDNRCGPSFAGNISNYYGIYLYNSDDNTISGNVVRENARYGIRLYSSERNQITDNEVDHNSRNGIHLNSNSDGNTISGNIVEYNGDSTLEIGSGLAILASSSNTIDDNSFRVNEEHGIYLDDADNSTISSNMCHFNALNGIYLANESNDNTIQLNQCNGNSNSGIEVDQSSSNDIQQNTTGSSAYGITLDNSADNEVTYNTCNFNEYGVYLSEAASNEIMNNSAQLNSERGIYLTQSDDNELVSNSVWENYDGIVASNSSDRNLFQDNSSSDNDEIGIWISGGSENQLIGNSSQGNYSGLSLSSGANDNEMSENVMVGNEYGARISLANNNRFWLNTFGSNNLGVVYSYNSTNYWSSESILTYRLDHPGFDDDLRQGYLGNRFYDHPGSDSDGNGIMDTPYDLPGTEPDDYFPLSTNVDSYVIIVLNEGDVNGDGDLDLEDVITALQTVAGQSADQVFIGADNDGDRKIGLSEALYIMRTLGE